MAFGVVGRRNQSSLCVCVCVCVCVSECTSVRSSLPPGGAYRRATQPPTGADYNWRRWWSRPLSQVVAVVAYAPSLDVVRRPREPASTIRISLPPPPRPPPTPQRSAGFVVFVFWTRVVGENGSASESSRSSGRRPGAPVRAGTSRAGGRRRGGAAAAAAAAAGGAPVADAGVGVAAGRGSGIPQHSAAAGRPDGAARRRQLLFAVARLPGRRHLHLR